MGKHPVINQIFIYPVFTFLPPEKKRKVVLVYCQEYFLVTLAWNWSFGCKSFFIGVYLYLTIILIGLADKLESPRHRSSSYLWVNYRFYLQIPIDVMALPISS